jgi:peptidoglycan glycosyltransferase
MIVPIRRVGLGIVVLMALLVGQLTYVHLVRAERLNADPANVRVALRDFKRSRGPIITIDGITVARTVASRDEYEYQREYPHGTLYAHITGYQSLRYGLTGIERVYDDVLLGKRTDVGFSDLGGLLDDDPAQGTVVLSIDSVAQNAARDALGGSRGSVIVLDTLTGGVVAMYSNPTYDPNLIAVHDPNAAEAFFDTYVADPENPMRSRAYRDRFPAGSTFKIVTTGVGLDAGVTSPDRRYPELEELPLPLTDRTLSNFDGDECGGTLAVSFRDSCNTTFGQIGLDLAEQFATGVEAFGINTAPPPIDLTPPMVRSEGPVRGSFKAEAPLFAQAGIGQGPVATTPMEMAMVAQCVANGGRMLVPHFMHEIRGADNSVVERATAKVWRACTTAASAASITDMMIDVVANGTGTRAQIPGVEVAGKTGTAQQPGGAPHAWFVGFAPARAPRYAIAVIVERGGELGDDATGGRVAAPIAQQVLATILAERAA